MVHIYIGIESFCRHIYPHCNSIQDFSEAVEEDIANRRRNKKQYKPPTIPSLPPAPTTIAFSSSNAVACSQNDVLSQPSGDISVSDPVSAISQAVSTKSALLPVAVDDLSETVAMVVQNAQREYNIDIPEGYAVRQATVNDVETIMGLVRELAEYERALDRVKLDPETLARDGWGRGLDGTTFRPYFYVYLVDKITSITSVESVGMALFFPVYSTWEGRFLYLEDLYVQEAHRGKGLGCALMRIVGAVAHDLKIPRYQWQCLAWNEKPLEFYKSTGAVDLNEWTTLRIEGSEDIERFVREGTYAKNRQGITSNISDVATDCGGELAGQGTEILSKLALSAPIAEEAVGASVETMAVTKVVGGDGGWADRFAAAREVNRPGI